MRIGFIGLGNMGGPMALNLIKAGHTLIVNDVRREAAAPHLERGAKWADNPKAVARESELILTSLPGPKMVPIPSGPRSTAPSKDWRRRIADLRAEGEEQAEEDLDVPAFLRRQAD